MTPLSVTQTRAETQSLRHAYKQTYTRNYMLRSVSANIPPGGGSDGRGQSGVRGVFVIQASAHGKYSHLRTLTHRMETP